MNEQANHQVPETTLKRKKKRRKKRYKLRLIITLLLVIAIIIVTHLDYFDTDKISVTGNNEISTEEIIKLAKAEKGKSVFDTVPFIAQGRIEKNLYIEEAQVSWKLPNRIKIVIKEKDGLCQLKMGKKFVVTDNEGKVIEISKDEKHFTMVEGVKVLKADVKRKVKVEEKKRYKRSLEFIAKAHEGDLFFKKINLKKDKVEAYVFDELLCTGNYDDVVKSIESGTLKSVIYDLYQKGREKGTISVRENNYCFFTPK